MFKSRSRFGSGRSHSREICGAPRMEELEARRLLAVAVVYTPTSVTIKGDTVADTLTIDNSGPGGTYKVTGTAGTTVVTTGTAPAVSSGVSIKVTMPGTANNVVTFNNLQAKDVTFTGSAGYDDVRFTGDTISGKTTISLGNGSNVVNLYSGTYVGAVTITSGSSPDNIFLGRLTGGTAHFGAVTIKTGANNDTVGLGVFGTSLTDFSGAVNIDMGSGNDNVYLGRDTYSATSVVEFKGDLNIKLGDGNDTFSVNPADSLLTAYVDRNFSLDLGTGDDTTNGLPAGHLVFQPSLPTIKWKTVVKSGSGTKTAALLTGLLNAHWDPTRSISFQW